MKRLGAMVLAAVMAAGCLGSTADLPDWDNPPVLKPGFSWTWETHSPAKAHSNRTGEPYRLTLTLLREWQTDTGEVNHPSEHGFLASRIASATAPLNIAFLRSADLRVEMMTSPSWGKTDVDCIEYRFQFRAPPPFLHFPLTPGKTWRDETPLDQSDAGADSERSANHMVIEGRVVRREPVTVAAGHFDDALRLEFTYRVEGRYPTDPEAALTKIPTVMHYSPTAKNIVRMETPLLFEIGPLPGLRPGSGQFNMPEAGPGKHAVIELTRYSFEERPPTTPREETEMFMLIDNWNCPPG